MKHKLRLLKLFAIAFFTVCCVGILLIYHFIWRCPSAEEIFKNAMYSVVELKAQTGEDTVSYGTAVFIHSDGTLASNAHMVVYKQGGIYKAFESLQIRFSFEKDYRNVLLISYDLTKDISLLRLSETEGVSFKAIQIKEKNTVVAGDTVYAVGNGMNHGIGMSRGIVSLPQVNIEYQNSVRQVIQSDLVINEGNSGGALLDERGRLIGITTFRLRDSSGNIIYGIAYSIPISDILNYSRECQKQEAELT